MKTKLLLLTIIIFFASCRQVKELITLTKCDFRLATVENINMAGISVQKFKSFTDLSIMDGANLIASVAKGTLPLSLTLNVEARNPNTKPAALNKLDWILLIDDIDVASGTTTKRVEIPPSNGTGIFPVQITTDLFKVLSGQSGKNMINFGLNLAGYGNRPTRIALKAKPTIMIGNSAVEYPGFITIKNEYGSN